MQLFLYSISDIGTPNKEKEFTVYDYIKNSLIEKGIPEEQIALIHDAKTDAARATLFQEMRSGKKKILIGSTDKCGTGVNVQKHLTALHHIDCPWKPSAIEQRDGRGIRQGNENEEVAIYRYVTKETFDAYNWGLIENKQRFISQVLTGKVVSRTCDDIDEATLSYAEIKAIATGNPLIKEKMQLDNDVQKLKVLKTAYDSQRYTLQDNFMIRFPKLIKAAKEKLACVREDIKLRDVEMSKLEDFAITIGNITYRERPEGGIAAMEALSKCKVGEVKAIGRFQNFELLAEKGFLGANHFILRNQTDYRVEVSTSALGNMVKLEHVFKSLHENEEYLTRKLEGYERDLAASKLEYEKPFQYADELKEKLQKQHEINVKLDLDKTQEEKEQISECIEIEKSR